MTVSCQLCSYYTEDVLLSIDSGTPYVFLVRDDRGWTNACWKQRHAHSISAYRDPLLVRVTELSGLRSCREMSA